MTIQVNTYCYCSPRSIKGPWTEVEVSYPSIVEPLLWPYAENQSWYDTVYAYVPIQVVVAIIELHGGFKKQIPANP